MAKGGRPRLPRLSPLRPSQVCCAHCALLQLQSPTQPELLSPVSATPPSVIWPGTPHTGGRLGGVWQGHSHLGSHDASDPRVSLRFLAED